MQIKMGILALAFLILAQQLRQPLAHPPIIIEGTTVKPGFQSDMGKLGKSPTIMSMSELNDDVAAVEPYYVTIPLCSLPLNYSIEW